MAADAAIESVHIRTGDRIRVRGYLRAARSGERFLYPEGEEQNDFSSSRGAGLRLSGVEALDRSVVHVTGVWRDGVVDVELAAPAADQRDAIDPQRDVVELREWLRQEITHTETPLTDPIASDLIDHLQGHPDVVRVTRVSLARRHRVLVAAAHPSSSVAMKMADAIRNGYVVVVACRWSRDQVDRAREALGQLPEDEIMRIGEGVNARGEPYLFAHTRRPVTLRHGLSPELVRIYPWIELESR